MATKPETPELTLASVLALVEEKDAPLAAKLREIFAGQADQVAELEKLTAQYQASVEEIASLKQTAADAESIIQGQTETIASLEARILALQTSPAAFPTIAVGKETYEVRGKSFKYNNRHYTLDDLLKDKALQKELVGKKVGFLIKVE